MFFFFWAHAVRARGSDGHSIVCDKQEETLLAPSESHAKNLGAKNQTQTPKPNTHPKQKQTKTKHLLQSNGVIH